MQISYQFRYQKALPLLPRQRKLRYEEADGTYIVDIEEVSETEAPVAFLECFHKPLDFRSYEAESSTLKVESVPDHQREWRYYKDQLWTSEEVNYWRVEPYELKELYNHAYNPAGISSWKDTWEQAVAKIEKYFQRYIVINGKAYLPASGEPRLYWKFDYYSRKEESRIYVSVDYEYRYEKSSYYRIDQLEELLKRIDSFLEEGEASPEIPVSYEIFIPEATKLNPQRDVELEREERSQADLNELRHQLKLRIGSKKEDQLRALKILIAELNGANTDQV